MQYRCFVDEIESTASIKNNKNKHSLNQMKDIRRTIIIIIIYLYIIATLPIIYREAHIHMYKMIIAPNQNLEKGQNDSKCFLLLVLIFIGTK